VQWREHGGKCIARVAYPAPHDTTCNDCTKVQGPLRHWFDTDSIRILPDTKSVLMERVMHIAPRTAQSRDCRTRRSASSPWWPPWATGGATNPPGGAPRWPCSARLASGSYEKVKHTHVSRRILKRQGVYGTVMRTRVPSLSGRSDMSQAGISKSLATWTSNRTDAQRQHHVDYERVKLTKHSDTKRTCEAWPTKRTHDSMIRSRDATSETSYAGGADTKLIW